MAKININGITREMTAEELAEMKAFEQSAEFKQMQIMQLKNQLAETYYKAIEFAEGWISAEEYEPIKAERQAIRNQINELEK
jgi:hypothetical protein